MKERIKESNKKIPNIRRIKNPDYSVHYITSENNGFEAVVFGRSWFSGKIIASHAMASGSIPEGRILFLRGTASGSSLVKAVVNITFDDDYRCYSVEQDVGKV